MAWYALVRFGNGLPPEGVPISIHWDKEWLVRQEHTNPENREEWRVVEVAPHLLPEKR